MATLKEQFVRVSTRPGSPELCTCLSGSQVHRAGTSIVEMIGACFILGILFSITVPMFMVIARERRTSEQRQFAQQHAANLLELAAARQWKELEPGELKLPEADQGVSSVLPGLERSVVVKQNDDDPPSRRIVASVRWKNHVGQPVSSLELSTWVYPTDEVP